MPRKGGKKKKRTQKKKTVNDPVKDLKDRGDGLFRAERFQDAIDVYTKAAEYVGDQHELYYPILSNRSAAYVAMQNLDQAMQDAEDIIVARPDWDKGYLRKAKALTAAMRYHDALQTYAEGLQAYPDSQSLVKNENILQEMVQEIEEMQKSRLENESPEQDKYQTMIEWLEDGGSKFPKLFLEYYSEEYRGVHTLTKIPKGEIILEVPLDLIMSSDIAKSSEIGMAIKNSGYKPRSTHSWLASYLLQEKHNPDSRWRVYIDVLPQNYRTMPIFFDEEERKYLKGSFSLKKMRDRVESLTAEYEGLCNYVPQYREFTYEDFVWARLVVITRIFGYYIDGRKTEGLVAMADMLNHKFPEDKDVKWGFSDERNSFIMTSIKTIERGAQVFDSYGRKCNHRFFVNYGFSLEENRDNECVFVVEVPDGDPYYDAKARILLQQGHDTIMDFQFSANPNHEQARECFGFLRICYAGGHELMVLPEDELKFEDVAPLSVENEKKCLRSLEASVIRVLDGFETTLEEDNEILANDDSLTFNIRNAILMRRGEKQVCHFWLDLIERALELFDLPWKDFKKIAAKSQQNGEPMDWYILVVMTRLMKNH